MLNIIARAAVAASFLFTAPADAAWPERPVTLIVPFAAGGLTDVMARLTAEVLHDKFNQAFIVQNEVGAGGILATANAARAKPDGYTLLFGPVSLMTLSPMISKVNYDPDKDFAPVSIVASTPFVVTITDGFPAKNVEEFISEVKKKPGGYTYASAGTGTTTQAASLLFLKAAGLQMVHVPYRGVAPAFADMMAGHVQMTSASPVEIKPHLNGGKVRPLGVTSKERSRQLPDVPTISETLPMPVVATHNGLFAPKQTPQEIIDTIAKEVVAAVKSAEFSDKLLKVGFEPFGSTSAEMAATIAADRDGWLPVKNDMAVATQ
ncbi:MAG: tripartite tricarboxylate transporter substrate binding protein [Alphaproteobacteria bacterium]|nr:tripartite tricarboxylate transporter substrate binding protein [Alphaproteobacteria bacterium]